MIIVAFPILYFGDLVEGLKDGPGIPNMQHNYKYRVKLFKD